jgi:acetyl-CoA decarbonylase/synthase complex subunit gamma
MALTGLQIFKLMPKTNCKKCGQPTCLAFSMALASSKTTLDACPFVTDEAKEALGAAAAPPVAKVVMGSAGKAREMGDETVLFRHDKMFFHPACIAVAIDGDLGDDAFSARLAAINDLKFERVGQHISIDAIALVDKTQDPSAFAQKAKIVAQQGAFAPIFISASAESLAKAVEACAASKPLLYCTDPAGVSAVASAAKGCPVVVPGNTLDEIAKLSEKVSSITKNLVLAPTAESAVQKLADLTQIRRQAIRKKVRPLGYPSLVSVCGLEPKEQVAAASMYVAKYGSAILMDTIEKAHILPLCALRQNIFSDPQKPAQVEPGMYPIGDATPESPVFCTTNFSLTYYTVEGEIASSKIPSWIIATPTDGTSVLTAWAAGKYTADKIAEYLKEIEIDKRISHNHITIPGYVAVLKAPLEEKSGRKVIVGPNEASALPAFVKANFA